MGGSAPQTGIAGFGGTGRLYRTARTPYQREIMDALSPRDPAQRVTFMTAAQVGAAEAGNNWIGFVIHHAPGPMLAVLPTVEMAKRTSRGRLDPLISESPALRGLVNPTRSRGAGGQTGAKLGRCFRATWPMSGMALCIHRQWLKA